MEVFDWRGSSRELLPKNQRTDALELRYSQDLQQSEQHGSGYRGTVAVTEQNGAGMALIDQRILPGPLTILAPFGSVLVARAEAAKKVVIDLREGRSVATAEESSETVVAPSKRLVILRLVPPEGWPIPEGEVNLGFLSINGKWQNNEDFRLPLKSGEAQIEVPINASEGKGAFYSRQLGASGFWMEDLRRVDIEPAIKQRSSRRRSILPVRFTGE